MKRLVLNKLVIVSQKNQEAKIIEFDAGLNIITGDNPDGTAINRTGKSVVMKSIYHALGANLKKYTSNWDNLELTTIISFTYDGTEYELYRNDERFLLHDGFNNHIFNSISELRDYYVDLFNFKLRLPIRSTDDSAVFAYPGAMFMPFYIDQDKGWSGSWDSFADIFSGKWKTEILLYHMGIRTPKYYDLLDEKAKIELEQKECRRQENTLNSVIKTHVSKYGEYLDLNIDIAHFESDITNLTDELNEQLAKKNIIKDELIKCFNEMNEISDLYSVALKNYNELLSDTDYVDDNIPEEFIICPICGTSHENSVQNKFLLYSEIEECEETMQSYFEKRSKIEKRIALQSEKLNNLEEYIKKINSILEKKRDTITFRDVIIAEGSKSILEDMRNDLNAIKAKMFIMDSRLKDITKEQTAITREGKHIGDKYLEKLKNNLSLLDVTDIDSQDLEKITPSFKSGGNDLPCAILAQVYAIYAVSTNYSYSPIFPIVLDAIFQQEPAKQKIQTIWEFAIKSQPNESQLIISTTEMHGYEANGKIIPLVRERGLLNQEDYQIEHEKVQRYKSILLRQ